MKRIFIYSLFTVFSLSLLSLTGCSDGGSSPASSTPTTKTTYLVGGLIEGMPYTTGSTSGKTGRLGNFTHQSDQSCVFQLGKMSFTVPPEKLQKGYVTVYDLTDTTQKAQTLMAIIDSISHRRPNTELVLMIDNNLARRIPTVDLTQGDTAVKAALETFKGTVTPVTVAAATARLGKSIKPDNTPVLTHTELVAQGKALLDSLHLHPESGKEWGSTTVSKSAFGRFYASISPYAESMFTPRKAFAETNHDNRVNLRFYDYLGNPMILNPGAFSYTANPGIPGGGAPSGWLWVTSGQNPQNSVPSLGQTQADISGYNIMGIDLYVGRSADSGVAWYYQNAALYPKAARQAQSIFAAGADPAGGTNVSFPQQLNFAYAINLSGGSYTGSFYCPGLLFGQGSTEPTWSTFLDIAEKLGDTVFEGVEAVSEEGANVGADAKFLLSYADFLNSLLSIVAQNWWVAAVNGSQNSWRVSYGPYKTPTILMACYTDTSKSKVVPVMINSTYDDHTFDIYVIYPWLGQKITGINP